jgi:hypothetical protein
MQQFVNVEGLGRLPQFSHAAVAGDTIYVSGTLGTAPGSLTHALESALHEVGALAGHEQRRPPSPVRREHILGDADDRKVVAVDEGSQRVELTAVVGHRLTGPELAHSVEPAVGSRAYDPQVGNGGEAHRSHPSVDDLRHRLIA